MHWVLGTTNVVQPLSSYIQLLGLVFFFNSEVLNFAGCSYGEDYIYMYT